MSLREMAVLLVLAIVLAMVLSLASAEALPWVSELVCVQAGGAVK